MYAKILPNLHKVCVGEAEVKGNLGRITCRVGTAKDQRCGHMLPLISALDEGGC